jgi:hypothetical protein
MATYRYSGYKKYHSLKNKKELVGDIPMGY